MSDLRYLLVARAVGGENGLEIRMGLTDEPDPQVVAEYKEQLALAYEGAFGESEDVRVGVGILPWVDAIDDPDGVEDDPQDGEHLGYLRFDEPDDPEWDAGGPPQ